MRPAAATIGASPAEREREQSDLLALARRHWAAVALALLLAAALVAPRWWFLVTAPPEGARLQLTPWGGSNMASDETLYWPQIRDAAEGQVPVRDPYLLEHRDAKPQPGMFWQEIIGVSGRAIGSPFVALALVATAGALAAFLLYYALALRLTGSAFAAAAVLPVTLLAVQVFNVADGFLPLRHWDILRPIVEVDPQREFHVWSRFLSPVVVNAPFFGGVLALPEWVERGSRRALAAAIACLALLIYSYAFYWTAAFGALALWGAWLAWRRDWTAVRRLGVAAAAAVVIASPELLLLAWNAASISSDVRDRTGLDPFGVDTGLKVSIAQRVLVGLPFLWALRWRERRSGLYAALFFVPLALYGVKGIVPQQWHYGTRVWGVFALPVFIAGGAELVRRLPRPALRYAGLAFAAVAVIGVAYVCVLQARAVHQVNAAYATDADERAVYDWIDGHLGRDDVIVSPSITTSLEISSLTPASVYMSEGFYTRASDDELVERYLRASAAFGIGEDTTFRRLEDRLGYPFHDPPGTTADLEARAEEYMAYYLLNWEVGRPQLIRDRLAGWRAEFRAIASSDDVLGPYAASYVFCGHRERAWAQEIAPRGIDVTEAYRRGDAVLYRIVEPTAAGARPFEGCG